MSVGFCSSSVKADSDIFLDESNDFYYEDIRDALLVRANDNVILNVSPEIYYGDLGDDFRFDCSTNIVNPTYDWQYYRNGQWRDISVNNGLSYLTLEITESRIDMQFRCLVTDEYLNTYISNVVQVKLSETLTIGHALSWLGITLFSPLFNFTTPWGITFGAVIVGVFGAPLLVKAYKKFF